MASNEITVKSIADHTYVHRAAQRAPDLDRDSLLLISEVLARAGQGISFEGILKRATQAKEDAERTSDTKRVAHMEHALKLLEDLQSGKLQLALIRTTNDTSLREKTKDPYDIGVKDLEQDDYVYLRWCEYEMSDGPLLYNLAASALLEQTFGGDESSDSASDKT